MARPNKWAPHPDGVRERALAMIRGGASYNQAAHETGASPSIIGRWVKAAMVAGARSPEARRAWWEACNPHLVRLTPEELAEYRFLCGTKRLTRDEALAVIADTATRTIRKAA